MDEKLNEIRGQRRDLEARRDVLRDAAQHQPDLDAAVERALGYLGRFREVLAQGTNVEKKEFIRGFVNEIRLHPGTLKGEIRFYDLVAASFWCTGWTRQKLCPCHAASTARRNGTTHRG
jgi:hypothetical protein